MKRTPVLFLVALAIAACSGRQSGPIPPSPPPPPVVTVGVTELPDVVDAEPVILYDIAPGWSRVEGYDGYDLPTVQRDDEKHPDLILVFPSAAPTPKEAVADDLRENGEMGCLDVTDLVPQMGGPRAAASVVTTCYEDIITAYAAIELGGRVYVVVYWGGYPTREDRIVFAEFISSLELAE